MADTRTKHTRPHKVGRTSSQRVRECSLRVSVCVEHCDRHLLCAAQGHGGVEACSALASHTISVYSNLPTEVCPEVNTAVYTTALVHTRACARTKTIGTPSPPPPPPPLIRVPRRHLLVLRPFPSQPAPEGVGFVRRASLRPTARKCLDGRECARPSSKHMHTHTHTHSKRGCLYSGSTVY